MTLSFPSLRAGANLLHAAACSGNADLVALVLAKTKDTLVRSANNQGAFPIHAAAMCAASVLHFARLSCFFAVFVFVSACTALLFPVSLCMLFLRTGPLRHSHNAFPMYSTLLRFHTDFFITFANAVPRAGSAECIPLLAADSRVTVLAEVRAPLSYCRVREQAMGSLCIHTSYPSCTSFSGSCPCEYA